jgi:hypothetical protein
MRWRRLAAALGAVALLAGGLNGLYRLARSRTTQLFGTLVARVETPERVVALTFDDGPTAAFVDELLSALGSRHVRATFFVNGAHVSEAPEIARRLVAAGHELGNHAYWHERMVLRSPRFIRYQLGRTDELIRAAGQQAPSRSGRRSAETRGPPVVPVAHGQDDRHLGYRRGLAGKRLRPGQDRVGVRATRPAGLDHPAPRVVSGAIRISGSGAPDPGRTAGAGVPVRHRPRDVGDSASRRALVRLVFDKKELKSRKARITVASTAVTERRGDSFPEEENVNDLAHLRRLLEAESIEEPARGIRQTWRSMEEAGWDSAAILRRAGWQRIAVRRNVKAGRGRIAGCGVSDVDLGICANGPPRTAALVDGVKLSTQRSRRFSVGGDPPPVVGMLECGVAAAPDSSERGSFLESSP